MSDRPAHIPRRRQAQQRLGRAIAPRHPVVLTQYHSGVGQRSGGLLKLLQQLAKLALAFAILPAQAGNLRGEAIPNRSEPGRVDVAVAA